MLRTLAITALLALSGCQVVINEAVNFGSQIVLDDVKEAVHTLQPASSEPEPPKAAP